MPNRMRSPGEVGANSMSRGPGKWQRLILKSVAETEDWLFLGDLLPPRSLYIQKYRERWLDRGASDSEAIKRAARVLSGRREIEYGTRSKAVAPYTIRYRAAVRVVSK